MMLLRVFLPVLLFFSACHTATRTPTAAPTVPFAERPKNIILLIGDGMATAQVSAGIYWKGKGKSVWERFRVVGFHKTHAHDERVTDSAAGATAFACGQKQKTALSALCRPNTNLVAPFSKNSTPAAGPPVWWCLARLRMPLRPRSSPIRTCVPSPRPLPKTTCTPRSTALSAEAGVILKIGRTKRICSIPCACAGTTSSRAPVSIACPWTAPHLSCCSRPNENPKVPLPAAATCQMLPPKCANTCKNAVQKVFSSWWKAAR
ncbi:MAG: alkaline phosphatase [Lewinellaceae bacterium]|nr:alkaline phosphatase [Lewinellaceae bacterium]